MNHLYPFLVTLELLPIVVETASTSGDGRILFVSSSGHVRNVTGPVNFETIDSDLDYGRLKSYGRTKLYNVSLLHSFWSHCLQYFLLVVPRWWRPLPSSVGFKMSPLQCLPNILAWYIHVAVFAVFLRAQTSIHGFIYLKDSSLRALSLGLFSLLIDNFASP